jgi:DNA repair protein RadD
MELREYQANVISRVRDLMAITGKRRVVLQAACGAGKTIIAAEFTRAALEKGSNILFLVNRRDLVKQTVDKFTEYGLGDEIGVIMSGEQASLTCPIQIASLQTYVRRLKLDELEWNAWFHRADLVIYDECHSCNAKTYREVIDLYQDKYIIGLSATPCRSDGTGLGEVFDGIVQCVPIGNLIEQGHLVPMVYYAPSTPDLTKLRTVAGDYEQKELGNRVDKPKLIGDIFENWARVAGGRQTVIFAVNVKHSLHIKEHFEREGVKVEHIDAHTKDEDRVGIYSRFETGETQVLTNVGIATEGSDFPFVSCIVVARPTKSLGRWIQMAGRGMRPSDGKENCIILDHSGCVAEHGFVDEDIDWSLDGKKPAFKKRVPKEKIKKIMTCEGCKATFYGPKCPECGMEVAFYGRKVAAIEAELEEINREKSKKRYTSEEKRVFFGMLEYERRLKGYAPGWSAHKHREKFGTWPNAYKGQKPIPPDDEFRRYMKYLRIRWAKSKHRENGVGSSSISASA